MSELVQVAAEVVWLQKLVVFSTLSLHHPGHSSEMSGPISIKTQKDGHYFKSNFCENFKTWVCDSKAVLECDAV
jgi:hypothetical protein